MKNWEWWISKGKKLWPSYVNSCHLADLVTPSFSVSVHKLSNLRSVEIKLWLWKFQIEASLHPYFKAMIFWRLGLDEIENLEDHKTKLNLSISRSKNKLKWPKSSKIKFPPHLLKFMDLIRRTKNLRWSTIETFNQYTALWYEWKKNICLQHLIVFDPLLKYIYYKFLKCVRSHLKWSNSVIFETKAQLRSTFFYHFTDLSSYLLTSSLSLYQVSSSSSLFHTTLTLFGESRLSMSG